MRLLGLALLVIASQLNVGLAYSLQRTNKAGIQFEWKLQTFQLIHRRIKMIF
jgi:hypothetical protein